MYSKYLLFPMMRQLSRSVWEVRSFTDPSESYMTTLRSCTCYAFTVNSSRDPDYWCKHMYQLAASLVPDPEVA